MSTTTKKKGNYDKLLRATLNKWNIFRLFWHESKVRNLNDHSNCAIWLIIRMTVFFTMCMQNYIAMRNLNCAIQMMVRRCFPVTYLSNHAAKSPWPLNCDLGGGATWPNHFRLYTCTMHCICTEAQEMRAPCMFDWQGTQTSSPAMEC